MNNLILQGSEKTPHINLNRNGDLSFHGVSTPEDAAEFYFEIMEWISDYYRNPCKKTHITISFRYLNSTSSSMLVKMFYFLNKLQAIGKTQVKCQWYYETSDENMLEYIQHIRENAELIDFSIHPTDNIFDAQAS